MYSIQHRSRWLSSTHIEVKLTILLICLLCYLVVLLYVNQNYEIDRPRNKGAPIKENGTEKCSMWLMLLRIVGYPYFLSVTCLEQLWRLRCYSLIDGVETYVVKEKIMKTFRKGGHLQVTLAGIPVTMDRRCAYV